MVRPGTQVCLVIAIVLCVCGGGGGEVGAHHARKERRRRGGAECTQGSVKDSAWQGMFLCSYFTVVEAAPIHSFSTINTAQCKMILWIIFK